MTCKNELPQILAKPHQDILETHKIFPSPIEKIEDHSTEASVRQQSFIPPSKPELLKPLGFSRRPLISAKARAKNRQGLQVLQKNNFKAAHEAFLAAITMAEDYDIARYNLACTYAKQDEFEKAVEELEVLLYRDFVGFHQKMKQDADLQNFWTSVEGQRLQQRTHTLEQHWRLEAKDGVPMVAWDGKFSHGLLRTQTLRVGVYLAEDKRFLPLLPAVPQATGALLNLERGLAVVTHQDLNDCGADPCPRFDSFSMDLFHLFSEKPFRSWSRSMFGGSGQVQITETGARVQLNDCREGSCQTPWYEIEEKRVQTSLLGKENLYPELFVATYGAHVWEPSEPGYRVMKGYLHVPHGSPIELGKKHRRGRHVVLVRDGHALVISADGNCVENPDNSDEHFEARMYDVSVVQLTDGLVHHVRQSKKSNNALARFDSKGRVFLQTDATVWVWPSLSSMMETHDPESLPSGFLLSPPLGENLCWWW